ncbi:MAG: phosphatase PAP2 family protein [Peptococcaceae bacterium]|nr:phosphatase PAP2 family protein [Peptococcaceae bacterium]
MKKARYWIKAHPCAVLIFCMTLVLLWFYYLQKNNTPRYFVDMKIDDYIPFTPFFVIPYLSWFIYMAIVLSYFFIYSRADFIRAGFFILCGMSISMLCYTLFPYGNQLRPEIVGHSPAQRILRFVYDLDPPNNCLPSIHVLNTMGIHFAILRSPKFVHMKKLKFLSGVLMILICLSTVLIKQHSAADVILAAVLGMILYLLIYRPRQVKPGTTKIQRRNGKI